MDKFLQQFLMFFAESADGGDQGSGGSSDAEAGEDASGENDSSTEQPAEPSTEVDEPLEEAGKKALRVEREARETAEAALRELAGLSKKEVRRFIEDSKGAQDRVASLEAELEASQQTAQEAVTQAEKATADATRYRIAARFGISTEPGEAEDGNETPSDAELFLTGSTEEELLSQAQRLASLRKASLEDGLVDPTQGGSGKPAPPSTAEQFAQQLEDF